MSRRWCWDRIIIHTLLNFRRIKSHYSKYVAVQLISHLCRMLSELPRVTYTWRSNWGNILNALTALMLTCLLDRKIFCYPRQEEYIIRTKIWGKIIKGCSSSPKIFTLTGDKPQSEKLHLSPNLTRLFYHHPLFSPPGHCTLAPYFQRIWQNMDYITAM